jgi:type III restriction enzyme
VSFEVGQPILSSPFDEPQEHWYLRRGDDPERRIGRRPSFVFQPVDSSVAWDTSDGLLARLDDYERAYELVLVNRIRDRVREWRSQSYPGVTRTTLELLQWWGREGRRQPLFFAQLEAAETVIFLVESRSDLRQGLEVPADDPGANRREEGYRHLRRFACKMATGAGKTTVMGMLAAWQILNKVTNKTDGRFSDAVLAICPNVTIRDRLRELNPREGDASLYRTRDLVPEHLMPLLAKGRLMVTNWHVLERRESNAGEVNVKVLRTGQRIWKVETVRISETSKTGRGIRYLTPAELQRQRDAELIEVLEEELDGAGNLKSVKIRAERWVESDDALLARVLGRDLGKKDNVVVFNDEAHHAYRFFEQGADESEDTEEVEDLEEFRREATIWVEGLDLLNRRRGINFALDLSATPYYIARTGNDAGRPFPWVVSDFGLTDAIESGLVKIPRLPRADTAGADRSAYFNLWKWVHDRLERSERRGRGAAPKPEAVLRQAHVPIALLAGEYDQTRRGWEEEQDDDGRPPVFILVCRDTDLARVMFDWITGAQTPPSVAPAQLPFFKNEPSRSVTIRVDTKVLEENDSNLGKDNETRWMRHTLDTVGRISWPVDRAGLEIFPPGFEALAEKLKHPLHPPGRDIRCIVSVGMLTEGWDANTVTHVVGLRPFSSQLLCEQVVGRALRRRHYELAEDGRFPEELAEVLGVPFEVVPYKATGGGRVILAKRHHVRALPTRVEYEIKFPRVEWYIQEIRHRIAIDWQNVPTLTLDPAAVPPEVQMAGLQLSNTGAPAHSPVGRVQELTLEPYRAGRRVQETAFALARALTAAYADDTDKRSLALQLFPQMLMIVRRYLAEKVNAIPPYQVADVEFGAFFEQARQHLLASIRPDQAAGERPELPRLMHPIEGTTASVDFWTNKRIKDTTRSHINYVIADSGWESQAAYYIDKHKAVAAFFKNTGKHFTVPYEIAGERHEFWPDFIIRLARDNNEYLILETKGHDLLAESKQQAALRWCDAVTEDGRWGRWSFRMARNVADVSFFLEEFLPAGAESR